MPCRQCSGNGTSDSQGHCGDRQPEATAVTPGGCSSWVVVSLGRLVGAVLRAGRPPSSLLPVSVPGFSWGTALPSPQAMRFSGTRLLGTCHPSFGVSAQVPRSEGLGAFDEERFTKVEAERREGEPRRNESLRLAPRSHTTPSLPSVPDTCPQTPAHRGLSAGGRGPGLLRLVHWGRCHLSWCLVGI